MIQNYLLTIILGHFKFETILCVVGYSTPKAEFDPTLPMLVPSYGLFWDGLFFLCPAEAGVRYGDYLHTHLPYWNGYFDNFEVFS